MTAGSKARSPEGGNAYLRTMVMTASPAQLRLMLFDGAIRFAEQARIALQAQDYENLHTGITRCQDIVMELVNSLRPEHNPDLCDKLSALYVFIYTRLMNAGSRREPKPLEEALEMLRYERDTWAMVLEKLAAENYRAGEMRETPDAEAQNGAAGNESAHAGASTGADTTTKPQPGTKPTFAEPAERNPTADLIGGKVSVRG